VLGVAERAVPVVAVVPVVVVVAGRVVLARVVRGDDRGALGGRVGVDEVGQVGLLVVPVLHAVHAAVVVPAADRRDRDDALQPAHARGGDAVGQRAVPGLADHAGAAGGPARLHRGAVGLGGLGAPVQPVDDRLGAEHVGLADARAAVGLVAADRVHREE